MPAARPTMTIRQFAKTFVVPSLLIFVIPIISWAFFEYAESRYDHDVREQIQSQIRSEPKLSEEQRAQALEYFDKTPFSQQILDPETAAQTNSSMRFAYATFRWMIRLSVASVISGVVVFLFAGICVWFSLRSQLVQYWCLLISWHVLRIYGALQTILLAVLVTELSFWVTAILFESYSLKLILIAALLALVSVAVVIKAIFTNPKTDWDVEGTVLGPDAAAPLWQELNRICEKVGTSPPDQVIAGIDDNFYVTEHPLTVNGTIYRGKTLFVSLPLLKQLHSTEADAILAHEMAHFSGNDTLYSQRISPLLRRYGIYLQGLHEGGISKPIYYFMVCFRAMFDLSLNKLSREREFRADGISAKVTSARDFAAALLRVVAYSKFRRSIELDLFSQKQVLKMADVSNRIENGFVAYTTEFANDPTISQSETAHPFDSHPPTSQRLTQLGVDPGSEQARQLLDVATDGGWYAKIPNAAELEQQMWQAFEQRFREAHEQSLPYRLLPETPEEQVLVEAAVPALSFEGQQGTLTMDFEKVHHAPWPDPLFFREFIRCQLNDKQTLTIYFERSGHRERPIEIKKLAQGQEFLAAFQNYYGRYLAAADYQKQIKEAAEEKRSTPTDPAE